MPTWHRRAAVAGMVLWLAGCGGGSDDSRDVSASAGANTNDAATFHASFDSASLSAELVQGTAQTQSIGASLQYGGPDPLYLMVETSRALVQDVQGSFSGDRLSLDVTFRGDLSVGPHAGELLLHACTDDKCVHELAGSPVHLPLQLLLKPNIQVQAQVDLHRAGQEPAPEAVLPVAVPPEAGALSLQVSTVSPDAVQVDFDGAQLHVHTQQVRAGSYAASVTLQSASDSRYSRTVQIGYTVDPPPGGEAPLAVADSYRYVYLRQGGTSLQRIQLSRPTWTDALDPPQVLDPQHLMTLRDLGNDLYEATIDASGLPTGAYSASVRFSAGPTGGQAYATFSIWVYDAFYVAGDFSLNLSAQSGVADLTRSAPVLMADGTQATWTAVSKSPLLTVLSASGQTGVDPLQVRIDPSVLSGPDAVVALPLQLSVDRAGVLPQALNFVVSNQIPTLQRASPATLVGTSGRVYLDGYFSTWSSQLLQSGRLQVDGARLVQARYYADPRFVGDLNVLGIDLADMVPGQTVTVRVQNELLPSALALSVEAPTRVLAAYAPLPFASYRPGRYVPGLDAFYFAGAGSLFRWTHAGGPWSLTEQSVSGLIDAAVSPDEQRLYAATASGLSSFDPVSLALLGGSPLRASRVFDPQVPPAQRAFVFGADGRAFGATLQTDAPDYTHTVSWISSGTSGRVLADLLSAPAHSDPGYGPSGTGFGVPTGVVGSVNGSALVATDAAGRRSLYLATARAWRPLAALPAGTSIAAVSDDAARMVTSDGVLLAADDTPLGNLAAVVPLTHAAGGFGLTSDGRFGLVYGYRVATEAGAERARDATLWVVDLADVAATGVVSAPLVAALALPDAVGCTGDAAVGEDCRHTASIGVAPGNGSAFVLGPRGVAALPLPDAVVNAASVRAMRPQSASGAAPASTARYPVRRALKR